MNTVFPKDVAFSASRSIYYHSMFTVLLWSWGAFNSCKRTHSNAKKEIAFICAKPSVLEKSKSIEKLPKTIVSEVLQESGGFEGVLRNRKQIYNAKLRLKEEKDEVVETRDFYKREQNSQLNFIREVNLVPKVSVFVSTEQQLIDIERFYTKTSHFFILGFDSTYNTGSYYVTIST